MCATDQIDKLMKKFIEGTVNAHSVQCYLKQAVITISNYKLTPAEPAALLLLR